MLAIKRSGSAMLAISWIIVLFAELKLFFHSAARPGQTRFAVITG
jgi:hypothetical protein